MIVKENEILNSFINSDKTLQVKDVKIISKKLCLISKENKSVWIDNNFKLVLLAGGISTC